MKQTRSDAFVGLLVGLGAAATVGLVVMALWMASAMSISGPMMWWGPPAQSGWLGPLVAATLAAIVVVWLFVLAAWLWSAPPQVPGTGQ